jgi:hypothetical protein
MSRPLQIAVQPELPAVLALRNAAYLGRRSAMQKPWYLRTFCTEQAMQTPIRPPAATKLRVVNIDNTGGKPMFSSDELWAVGLMTYDEYLEAEGREPPGDDESVQIAAGLNLRLKGANDARSHSEEA